jgi:hypothetical protein
MAEEDEEKTLKDWLRIILPRVLRAALWGFIMGGELLIMLFIPDIGGKLQQFLPAEQTGFSYFLFIFIAFEVAIQLLRGTIIQYVLGMARALTSMIVLVFITNGGIMSFTISSSPEIPLPPGVVISFTAGFRIVLGVFLILSLLSIIKNLLQAINFLSEKAEEPVILPEFL